jgi:SAM-dependent methyltransferase
VTGLPLYDRIGRTYARVRRPDPRIEERIARAVGPGSTVVSVGAGTGSYEPAGTILAVEPSAAMIAQRPSGSAPAVQASAEAIPLEDGACDVALAVLTVHHWSDLEAGIAELRRVARRQVVLTWDPAFAEDYWLVADYLPRLASVNRGRFPAIERIAALLGEVEVEAVPVPHDCLDGFQSAYWRRPEAYLDPVVRAGISDFALLDDGELGFRDRLAADLESGAWRARHGDLLDLEEIDLGYRLLFTSASV